MKYPLRFQIERKYPLRFRNTLYSSMPGGTIPFDKKVRGYSTLYPEKLSGALIVTILCLVCRETLKLKTFPSLLKGH